MMTFDPARFIVRSAAGAQEVLTVNYISDFVAAASNKTTIAAVTGKRIKVLGGVLQSYGGTAGNLTFFSATTAGTLLFDVDTTIMTVALPVILPFNPAGYFETVTGEALNARATTGNQRWNLQYITYTP